MLADACWISGPAFEYGQDDAGYYQDHPNHVVGCTFSVSTADVRQGQWQLAIAVLGYGHVRLNGTSVEGADLIGYWTRFDRCVYYDVLDVSPYLVEGENTIEIELGNGFYNPAPMTLFGKYNLRDRLVEVGTPAVLCALTCGDALVVRSDETWWANEGRRVFNNVYLGETYDARRETEPVELAVSQNERNLERSPIEPCRRFERIEPVSIERRGGEIVLDFGEVVEGMADIEVSCRASADIVLRYAEDMRDGALCFDTNAAGYIGCETPRGVCPGGPGAPRMAIEQDTLRCPAGVTRFTNRFSYHSFRYVSIVGLGDGDDITVAVAPLHTPMAVLGAFTCDDDWMNELLSVAVRTKLNNVHGVFEDCARERFGYGGDMLVLVVSNAYLFDIAGMLDKTLADFERDQTERGGIPETAPFMGIGSNGPAYGEGPLLWQVAYPYLALVAERFCGRHDLLERAWPSIESLGAYLLSFDPAELSEHCLGDHGSILTPMGGFKQGTPDKLFVGWCTIVWGLRLVRECAERMDCPTTPYDRPIEELVMRIRSELRHDDGSYGEGTQTSWAFAAVAGLDDPAVLADRLASAMEGQDHTLSTGIFGAAIAFDLLNRYGYDEELESWLCREGDPSLRAMLADGNGALRESFSDSFASADHAMFSSYAQWFFQGLGGIRVDDDAVGCDRMTVRPYFSRRINRCSCTYATPFGTVRSEWGRDEDGVVTFACEVPESVQVNIELPSAVETSTSRDAGHLVVRARFESAHEARED